MSERPSLKPVYLITGSDRPKVETAVQRLRARFLDEATEIVTALETSGAEGVNLCNSGSLFGDARLVLVNEVDGRRKEDNRPPTGGWKADDVEAVASYLAAPAPDTVLALVGLEVKKDAALAKTSAKHGDVLAYDVPKRKHVAWVADRFRQAGVKADPDACALLIEYVGEEDLHGLANEIDKIATWAQGEPVGVDEIELLVSPVADVPSFALTDTWAARRPGALLEVAEKMLERSDRPRRDTVPRLTGSLNGHLTRLRQLKRLANEGLPPREAATRLKMHPFYGEKVYRQAEAFSDDELSAATMRLAELDLALKGGSRLSADVELTRALIDVSAEADRG